MTAATRTQYRYEHRLKKLVRETGNISVALEAGVPRSTAYGWLGDSQADVVTIEVRERDVADLEREVVLLRRRNARHVSPLRLIITVMKVSGFSLSRVRLKGL